MNAACWSAWTCVRANRAPFDPPMKAKPTRAQRALEKAQAGRRRQTYVLRLYIAGMSPRSIAAIQNIRKICEEHLGGRYDLQVVDIYRQPGLVAGEQIIAAPTLVKKLPLPLRHFIGDLGDTDQILFGMDLLPGGKITATPPAAAGGTSG